jgi:hypothetical protein
MGLPKFEMRALFTGLARKVRRFHVEEEERVLYNMLRGFSKLFGTVEHVLLASAYDPSLRLIIRAPEALCFWFQMRSQTRRRCQ